MHENKEADGSTWTHLRPTPQKLASICTVRPLSWASLEPTIRIGRLVEFILVDSRNAALVLRGEGSQRVPNGHPCPDPETGAYELRPVVGACVRWVAGDCPPCSTGARLDLHFLLLGDHFVASVDAI